MDEMTAAARGFVQGACPVLAERDAELAALSAASGDVAAGRPRLVLVTGDAGVGKSRLCAEFASSLSGAWSVIASVTTGTAAPFANLVDRVSAEGPPSAALAREVAAALSSRAGEGPVVWLVEDVHALDLVGLAALPEVLSELGSAQVLILATLRLGALSPGSDGGAAVLDLLRHPMVEELRVAGLGVDGVAEMAMAMRGATLEDATASALHQRTAGNPFFIEELLRSSGEELPWTITEVVVARVAALGSSASAAADRLALSAPSLPVSVLEASGGTDWLPLVDAQIAHLCVDGIALRHGLVSEILAARVAGPLRRELHGQLAAAFEASDAPPAERIAVHWSEAGTPERAARWAAIAGDRVAEQRAYRTAGRYYAVAIAGTGGEHAADPDLLERAALAAAVAGSAADAARLAIAADRRYRSTGEVWRAAAMWMNPGFQYLQRPVVRSDELETGMPWRPALEADEHARLGAFAEAAHAAREALAAGRRDGDTDVRAAAAVALVHAGESEAGLAELRTIRADAAMAGDDATLVAVLADLARVELAVGELGRAIALDHEALAVARRAPEALLWPQVQIGVALLHALAGQLHESETLCEELNALDIPVLTVFTNVPLAFIDAERGDAESSVARIEAALAMTPRGSPVIYLAAVTVAARAYLAAGDGLRALEMLEAADEVAGEMIDETRVDRLLLRARVGVLVGDPSQVQASSDALAGLALTTVRPALAAANLVESFLAAGRGDHAVAVVRAQAAAEAWERSPRVTHAADAWCFVAECALLAGDHDAAARAAREASSLAERSGAAPLARRAARASAEVHQGPRVPPEFALLSTREREIVRLVAEGRTNREIGQALFISEHTARNHLSNVFSKLGISRRSEVAALAARVEIVPVGPERSR